MTTSTDVEVRRLPVSVGIPLNGLDEAYRLAQALALASVLPNSLRGKPSDVLAILLYGQELGLAPMQSIQGIYVVKGKPQLSSQLWTAMARKAGHKVVWGDRSDKSATVTITRGDDPHPLTETFTIEDAAKAGLCSIQDDGSVRARSQSGEKLPWETYTKTMLANRAISNAGKLQCPEVAQGFAIEGDYDYIDPEIMEPLVVTRPEHHGDVLDVDEIDPEVVAATLDGIAAEFAVPTLPLGDET